MNISPNRHAMIEAELQRVTDMLAALVGQFDWRGCTCTFPSDSCCSYAEAYAYLHKERRP